MFRWFIALSLVGATFTSLAEPLSFDAALKLAEQRAPDIAGQSASVESARAMSLAAGRLPDPKLAVGIENVPVSGVDQWSLTSDSMTMQKIGVMQEFPNRNKRQAESDLAEAMVARAEAERRLRVLEVRREAAIAWINRFYTERRHAFLDELTQENRLFADAVQAQLAGGRGMPADVVAPKEEAAELADRRDELNADSAKAKAILKRWVGEAGNQPLIGEPPVLSVDADHLRTSVHKHPDLAAFGPMTAMAQAEVNTARAMKRPDWGVELMYGRRGEAFGDMVSLQFTLDLPLATRTRQDPQIESKRQEVTRVAAERESMLKEHTEELESELADYEALTRQLLRTQETRIPLARDKVSLQFASYRGGKGDLTVVLSARRELINQQFRLIDLQRQLGVIAAKLYFIYGEGAR
jgi:cobalt-zinc-cadmium efflux system outer membrane protein